MCAVTIEQLMGKEYPKRPNNMDESNEAEVAVEEARDVVRAMYKKNEQYLTEVLEGVKNNTVVPFIGAGFSAGSYPLWQSFLLELTSDVKNKTKKKVLKLLNKADFEGAASLLDKKLGQGEICEIIEDTFGEKTLGEAFEELATERRGIPSAFRGFVLTTNYDRLIERAYEAAGAPIERVCPHTAYQFSQAAGGVQGNGRLLLKLHGDAWDPTNAVITREDYDRAYGTGGEGAPLVEVMRRAFTGRRVLFLGCSLAGDRPLDVLHGCCEGMAHYALVQLPEETKNPDDPFDPVLTDSSGEKVPVYRKMRKRLRKLGIRPIWYPYGQHSALDALLGWLEGEMGPLPGSVAAKLSPIPESTYGIVGREDEVGEVVAMLSNQSSITLVTGPGGIGKTEICREALRRVRDSGRDVVYAVTVGASTAWAQCDAVAEALRIPKMEQREGVRAADYARYLTDKLANLERPVVYLDNWEDAWVASDEEGRRELVGLLRALRDGGSFVLASSREAAADYETGARIIRVHKLGRNPSVDLFRKVLEAKEGGPDPSGPEFEELVIRLEGHPLAIVLTATLAVSSPSWGDVLSRWAGASQHAEDPRHDSLETALRLSWDAVAGATLAHELWGVMALTPGDLPRSELDALADLIESGPCDWLPAYARLRDASLVSASGDGSLSMLRPVQEAFFSLADGGLVDHCLDLLTRRLVGIIEADDSGSGVLGTGTGVAHTLALASLLRALFLLGRSLGLRGLGAGAPALARALGNHYQFDWGASRPVLDALLRAARDEGDDGLAAFAARTSAGCAVLQGRLGDAESLLEEAERLHRGVGSTLGTANDLQDRAELAMRLGRLDEAAPLLEEAEGLHREAGDALGTANDLKALAQLAMRQGSLGDAESLLEEAEGLHREAGVDLGTANDLNLRARLGMRLGDLNGVGKLLEEAERLHRKAGDDLGTANDLYVRARLAMRLGNLDGAGALLEDAERLHRGVGSTLGTANDLQDRAELAMSLDRLDEAEPLLEEAERLHREAGSGLGTANDLFARAGLLAIQGEFNRALSELTRAEELYEGMGDEYSIGLTHELRDQIEQEIDAE